jgi:hypothetical protein
MKNQDIEQMIRGISSASVVDVFSNSGGIVFVSADVDISDSLDTIKTALGAGSHSEVGTSGFEYRFVGVA